MGNGRAAAPCQRLRHRGWRNRPPAHRTRRRAPLRGVRPPSPRLPDRAAGRPTSGEVHEGRDRDEVGVRQAIQLFERTGAPGVPECLASPHRRLPRSARGSLRQVRKRTPARAEPAGGVPARGQAHRTLSRTTCRQGRWRRIHVCTHTTGHEWVGAGFLRKPITLGVLPAKLLYVSCDLT